MPARWLRASVSILMCAALLTSAACSSSPKSSDKKKKRTILMTEYDDARVGQEASVGVAAEMGVLDDPDLTAYVSDLGHKLLRGVPRRSFKYQFSVVDQAEPNAFALPGGYIFISRGLLAMANSEDELACVIGHEITHAAHRHAAAQQQIAKRGNPLAMPWNRAARIAAYGRDMERDADRWGQVLCAAAGYDPMGMSTFLDNLGQAERLRIGYTRGKSFFDTHPGSQERAASNSIRASEIRWTRDPSLGDTHASHLHRIDGLAVGQRPESGVFVGERFMHPDLDFQVRFPRDWRTSNSNQAVGAGSPRGDAVVFLTADLPPGEPEQVAEAWLEKAKEEQRVVVEESKPVNIGPIEAWRVRIKAGGGGQNVIAYVTFLPYRGMTWRITGASPASRVGDYTGRILNTARSFRPLTEKERLSIRATRLRVVTARPGEDLLALGDRTGNAWDPSHTAVYNGIFVDHRFEAGELVKIAQSELYVPGID